MFMSGMHISGRTRHARSSDGRFSIDIWGMLRTNTNLLGFYARRVDEHLSSVLGQHGELVSWWSAHFDRLGTLQGALLTTSKSEDGSRIR